MNMNIGIAPGRFLWPKQPPLSKRPEGIDDSSREVHSSGNDFLRLPSFPLLSVPAINRKSLTLLTPEELSSRHTKNIFYESKERKKLIAMRFFISRYRIDYRYDNTNKSEYSLIWKINETSISKDWPQVGFKIAEVHKDKIGKEITAWIELGFYNASDGTYYTNKEYRLIGVTYERDYFPGASDQKVVVPISQVFTFRSSNISHYYQRINMSLNIPNGSFVDIKEKGFIRIHRWDAG